MAESLTSQAWARLDERYRVRARLADGELAYLDADEIKEVAQREPRLMTKFDTRESRPTLLAAATVLPVTNGRYVVLPGDGYHDLRGLDVAKRWPLPRAAAALETLPWSTGPSSESQALDMALAAGLLGDFLGEDRLHLTVRGRRRAPRMEFDFRTVAKIERLVADGVQVEVDSGLEGDAIHLVEAKLGTRDNFHVRQLYYPLRMWKEEAQRKEIHAVFMTWSNRRFALRRFSFDPLEGYHAIRLAAAADYVFDEEEAPPSLEALLHHASPQSLPVDVPFPQADDLRRVIDVVDAVGKGSRWKDEIARLYDFDRRQADYYGNAAMFLGLLDRGRGDFTLSPLGRTFLVSPLARRNLIVAERLAGLPVLRQAIAHLALHTTSPSLDLVTEWIEATTALRGATPRRRALTVLAWTRWLADVVGAPLRRGADDRDARM